MQNRIRIERDEIENLINFLSEEVPPSWPGSVHPNLAANLAALIEHLAFEPKAILYESRFVSKGLLDDIKDHEDGTSDYGKGNALALENYKTAEFFWQIHKDRVIPGSNECFSRPTLNSLEIAAADLLRNLYSFLIHRTEGSVRILELKMLRFITERDAQLVKKGVDFRDGPKLDRRDALRKVMEEAFKDLFKALGRSPKWREVLRQLPTGPGQVIQEIEEEDDFYQTDEGGIIRWKPKGQDKETSFKAFQKRLTRIRKKLLS